MFTPEHIALANKLGRGNLVEHLGIVFVPSAPGTLAATMPVTADHLQPMGLLHGGATAALAETVGSMGSAVLVDQEKQSVVGLEISANHLRGLRSGLVTCTGTVLHQGRSTHLWDLRVTDEAGRLVAACRLVIMVIDKRP